MFIKPDWPVPEDIIAFTTTKIGGVSKGDFESLNLSLNVGDDPLAVRKNRKLIEKELPHGAKIKWLQQVHGGVVTRANSSCLEKADASWTNQPGWACAIQTADCLPSFFSISDTRKGNGTTILCCLRRCYDRWWDSGSTYWASFEI